MNLKSDPYDDFETSTIFEKEDSKEIASFFKNVSNLDTNAYKEYLSKRITDSNGLDITTTNNYVQKIKVSLLFSF